MRALSIRQPWAWAIFNAGKDIENRDWRNKYCSGTIAIHVAIRKDSVSKLPPGVRRPRPEELITSAIIGVVDIVDIVTRHRSKWFSGNYKYGWVLRNPRPLPEPIKCIGARLLWEMKPDAVLNIERQLSL